MKKILGNLYKSCLGFLISFILVQNVCFAYETVLIDFPNNGWHKVFYAQKAKEIIGQYVPSGQTKDDYVESVILHSYKWSTNRNITPLYMLQYHLSQACLRDKDMQIAYLKQDPNDSMAMWCSAKTSQCEIIRAAQGYEGIITMHYVNKNPQLFQNLYPQWLNIMRDVKVYYSYYRWDVMMNKANTIEL